jgi:hypothetical protein
MYFYFSYFLLLFSMSFPSYCISSFELLFLCTVFLFFLFMLSFTFTFIFHLPLSFINVLPFFMVSPFVPFSASLYFLHSFIFLPIVDTYTIMSGVSYNKLHIKSLCHEYFLNFLSHITLAANKQGIHRDYLSACFISETTLFWRNLASRFYNNMFRSV